MALKKETQIIIGIGTASIIGYLYWKNNKKKYSSFVQSEYDSCVAQGNQPIDCCAKFQGVFENGVCNQPTPYIPSCPGGTIVNGLCVEIAEGGGGTTETTTGGTGGGTTTGGTTETTTTGTSGGGVTTTSTESGGSTTITTITVPSTPTMYPPVYFSPISRTDVVDAGDGGGGASSTDATPTDEFDWIPIILGGMTVALSIISEK